ncbi:MULTISPECIES: SGNH/GDSL hydrolase family protein [unclassified Nostoc]|uniref:SGNH/GDSL hydrolase family protein n=1 Tax=unclassified Nostoc TaxID=2593658 RepID=UPI002AD1F6C2|nr:SGNH/GDSL hydrolase family protein [Nostoc sp. DedQUE03]MDZ7971957.1 SGNH/GDSL hydrolase family protein [Nostoc sp. DedQUE03]MDZ8043760.1 SGNH/GDSL hydrolase family protein [Nostoc sp. DedQUE02]
MQKKIIATALFLLSFTFPSKVLAKNYDEIVIFGDSFSDTGNVFSATEEAIPPSSSYFNGRFSNGSIWVEYLASDLGIKFNPKTNFAYGGATTGFENIGVESLPGLQQQINNFTLANQSADPNSLYIVWAGTNDYLDYFFGGSPNPTQAVTNLIGAVKALAAVGAKDIMVVNQPNLGNFPVTGGSNQTSSILKTYSSIHNSQLRANLSFLNQKLGSDINIISLDVDSLYNRMIATPAEFGFTNVTDSCIGDLSVVPINISKQPVACTPDEFLFWDQVHPTTTTHKLIAELAFSALKLGSIPEPSPVLGLIVIGTLGIVGFLKHR